MRKQALSMAAVPAVILLLAAMLVLPASQGKAQSSADNLPAPAPPPYDPFEVVTSQPVPVRTPKARAALTTQLRRILAKRAFAAGNAPYTANISFNARGDVQAIGPGEMEETRNATGVRRWTGRLGGYSLTRIIAGGTHDDGSSGPIPMRLQMAREFIFGPPLIPMRFMRTAQVATSDGTSVMCILGSNQPSMAPGRDWSETEYCVDSQSDLLRIYSAAPGIYVVYDYNGASFHGKVVPDQVTITVAGEAVLEGRIAVRNPGSLDPVLFTPTNGMSTDGLQFIGGPPIRYTQFRDARTASGAPQPVVVHAILAPDGSVVEAEALQTSQPDASESAVELVRNTRYDETTTRYSVPPQLEIFVTVQ